MQCNRILAASARCAWPLAVVAAALGLSGCPAVPPVDGGAKLQLGERTTVKAQTIGAAGGVIAVGDTGTALDGLRIEVPAGALPGDTTFEIGRQPILSHDLGAGTLTPVPVLWIDIGGMEASGLITVRIPMSIAEGWFAMAFYYDPTTGAFEGIPQVAQDASSLTIATTHFSGVAVTQEEVQALLAQTWDTGYVPGVDDWQTANRGSYFAPRGFCAGSVYSSLWYFANEKKITGAQLYNRYENTLGEGMRTEGYPDDDESAIQFLSVVQDRVKTVVDAETWDRFKNLPGATDDLKTYCAVVSAMKRSNQPQLMGAALGDAKIGHALLAYKVEPGRVYVTNSNFPGQSHSIEFRKGEQKFQPYSSVECMMDYLFTNPDANPRDFAAFLQRAFAFDKFSFYGKTAAGEWSKVEQLCQRFLVGEIPNTPFPDYTLWAIEKKADGSVRERWGLDRIARVNDVDQSKIDIELEMTMPGSAATRVRWCRYGDPAYKLSDPPVTLFAGDNPIGFCVEGELTRTVQKEVNGQMQPEQVKMWQWLGFDWITLRWSGEEPVDECHFIKPNLNNSSWHMQWLNDCNTLEFDRDAVWEFYTDGSVGDHWLGKIKDMSWRMDAGQRLHIESKSYPPGTFFIYEGTLSADCLTLENGITFRTDDPGTTLSCWRAERRW